MLDIIINEEIFSLKLYIYIYPVDFISIYSIKKNKKDKNNDKEIYISSFSVFSFSSFKNIVMFYHKYFVHEIIEMYWLKEI